MEISLIQSQIVTITRPADVIAYAAKDAISDSTTVPTLGKILGIGKYEKGSGYITKVRAITSQSTNVARLRLHIFESLAVAPINDNAPFTALAAHFDRKVGVIDLPAFSTSGTGSDIAYSEVSSLKMTFQCQSQDSGLYFLIETLDIFTPASAQTFTFEFTSEVYKGL